MRKQRQVVLDEEEVRAGRLFEAAQGLALALVVGAVLWALVVLVAGCGDDARVPADAGADAARVEWTPPPPPSCPVVAGCGS